MIEELQYITDRSGQGKTHKEEERINIEGIRNKRRHIIGKNSATS